MAITTAGRKAWRDLGRRRARAVLTAATIALSVAGFGMLAVPGLIDRTMGAEVDDSRLYDISLPVRDIRFDEGDAREVAAIENVAAVSARVSYSTRALVGDRRVPVILWGIDDFARQEIDVIRVTGGEAPGAGEVLADTGNGDAVDVSFDVDDRADLVGADGSVVQLAITGHGRGLAYWQGPWAHPQRLVLYATTETVRALSGTTGITTLAVRLDDSSATEIDATVARLRAWLTGHAGADALTDLPLTREVGDWPGRQFAHQMTTFVYVLAGLAAVTSVFLIANTMNTLMAEQTAEIGIMKAIGGRRGQIAGVYLRTALYLALFGVVVGTPIGIVLASAIAGFVTSSVLGVPGRFDVSAPVVAASAAAAVMLTLGATLPALRRALGLPVRVALLGQGGATTYGASPLDRLILRARRLPRPLRYGTRNLVRNKRRVATATVQVALAVATALGFLNMATSFNRALDRDFAAIDWDASMLAPPGAPRLDEQAREIASGTPDVRRVEPVLMNTIELAGETVPALGLSATPLYRPDLRSGRWFTEGEASSGAAVAIVGPNVAREHDLQPDDTVTVQTAGGSVDLRIIGVDSLQRDSGLVFYVPLPWLQEATGWGDDTNLLWLQLDHAADADIDRTTNLVEDSLAAAGYRAVPEKLHELEAESRAANDAILNMITIVGGVVVLIGMVGLVNAMTMSIIERTREIGILRCVGARARDIRRTFVAESAVQAVIGWTLGLPLGLALSWGLARLTLIVMELEIDTVFEPGTALVVLVATVTLAVIVVLLPIRRVTHVNPGDALRYV